ncbi:carboxylesterase/lipase family protein [Thermoactinomyces vulgaris]|jgi:para-nitrobenzyl esterase|uniref:carboxylesterase/lipase family protein n=1 Tax=Thermoactinomyces vulgaris TaxID=2026 RepID=UPI00362C3E55
MNTLVETRLGKVQGGTDGEVCFWKGVPYAKPPVGKRRFQKPEPLEKWDGVWDATRFRSMVMQPSGTTFSTVLGEADHPVSEDGLYLNIWSPAADGKKRPVLFWIHGGAYQFGSGSSPWYDGAEFAKNGDVVVVTINYRLNVFGFLHLEDWFGDEFAASGNLGILDQVAALRWVKENISAFGGDPEQITIFGESAGAGSVGVLLSLPETKGLFQRAILQSGSGAILLRSPQTALDIADRILTKAGIRKGDRDRLLSIPAGELLEAAQSVHPGMIFGPVVDGTVLKTHPIKALDNGAAGDIPIIIGVTKDEYNLFTLTDPSWTTAGKEELMDRIEQEIGPVPEKVFPYYLSSGDPSQPVWQKLLRAMTYHIFTRGMLKTADAQIKQGGKVWVYRFDYETPLFDGRLKACHALEIPFVFHNLHQPGADVFTGTHPKREQISRQMHEAWIAFARTGNPNSDHLPDAWLPFAEKDRPVMVFDTDSRVESDLFAQEQEAWEHKA